MRVATPILRLRSFRSNHMNALAALKKWLPCKRSGIPEDGDAPA
jgi:hypothetical protein